MITEKIELHIPVFPWYQDHHFNGKTLLPAVEIMQILATLVQEKYPNTAVNHITDAHFIKFLKISSEIKHLETVALLTKTEESAILVELQSYNQSKSVRRVLSHAKLCFNNLAQTEGEKNPLPDSTTEAGNKSFLHLSAEQIYAELIPFGPTYHSLLNTVFLGKDSVHAIVKTPISSAEAALPRPLGSSFPLDGAMHAVCVHGQSRVDFVPFPLGFRCRKIHQPTHADRNYTVKALLQTYTERKMIYDLWISDLSGALCETVLGLCMQDASQGTIKPPVWLRENMHS